MHSLKGSMTPCCKSILMQEIGNIREALIKLRQLVNESPQVNGNGPAWKKLAHRAEADRSSLCRQLNDNEVFIGLAHLYRTTQRHGRVCESCP
jgi:hypothetical protein